MTMQPLQGAPLTAPRGRTRVVAWGDEETLSSRQCHLRVGQDLQALAGPVSPDLRGGLLEHLPGAPQAGWHLHPGPREELPPPATRALEGRVAELLAVVVPHRRRSETEWVPMPCAARCRPVASTCTPEPARSVWIPSGKPVLIGFLVLIEDGFFTHRLR